jgi:hypothetical protein
MDWFGWAGQREIRLPFKEDRVQTVINLISPF